MKMPYDIPGHKFEAPQQGAPDEEETAQIYTFLGLPKGLEDSPKDSRGNYLWWPEKRADWDQSVRYIYPDSIKLMLPFGPTIMR